MAWFGRKAGQGGVRPALVRTMAGVPAGDWPLSYDRQLRDAYVGNPIAQRAVRIVAEAAGGLTLFADGEDQAPAALAGTVIEMAAAHLLLHGNAYLLPGRDAGDGVAELYALRPERVEEDEWRP